MSKSTARGVLAYGAMSSARKPLREAVASDAEAQTSGVRVRLTPREGIGAVVLREAVEGIVSVEIADRMIALALTASKEPFPQTIEEVRAFVRGPLARELRRARLDDEADEIAARIERLGPRPPSTERDDDPTARMHRLALRPVARVQPERARVVVLATGTALADALAASPQGARLAILRVTTQAAFAGALHASGPLVVVIDGASDIDEVSLGAALSGRSEPLHVWVTVADTPRGRAILRALTQFGVAVIGVAEGGSIASIAEMLARPHA